MIAFVWAKERCHPEVIEISEEKASDSLQHLLDHTLNRLCETFEFNNSINFEESFNRSTDVITF